MYSTFHSIMRIRNEADASPASEDKCSQSSYNSKPVLRRKRRPAEAELYEQTRKLNRPPSFKRCTVNAFDALPEDLLITILGALISSASSPADLANAMLTCRRFCAAASQPEVLVCASAGALAVKASSWSDGAHRFLRLCADAGNVEACYTLGMIDLDLALAALPLSDVVIASLDMASSTVLVESRINHRQHEGGVILSGCPTACSHWIRSSRTLSAELDGGIARIFHTLQRNVVQIRFYCLFNRGGGASLMAKAAMQSHAAALHSLAVIQFNGSGGTRKDKDLKAGVALCVRAATLGHVDAMRELGHCLQDGYGVGKNRYEGRRLLLEANAREAAAAVVASPRSFMETAFQLTAGSTIVCPQGRQSTAVPINSSSEPGQIGVVDQTRAQLREGLDRQHMYKLLQGGGSCSLLSDFGCTVPPPKLHIANKFLVDWFDIYPPASGLRLCSHFNCGRPETRRHEFRRCSACGCVNYCSRACQALDWKIRHKFDCQPVADWGDRHDENEGEEDEQAYEDMDDS